MTTADKYKVYIDWNNDGGLYLSTFETGFDGWVGYGSRPAVLTRDNLNQTFNGEYSLRIDFLNPESFQFDVVDHGFDKGRFGTSDLSNPNTAFQFDTAGKGFDQGTFGINSVSDPSVEWPTAQRVMTDLTVGEDYTLSIWVNFGPTMRIRVDDIAETEWLNNSTHQPEGGVVTFKEVLLNFTATSTSHTIIIEIQTLPPIGVTSNPMSIDSVRLLTTGEDVTTDVLSRSDITFRSGRDLARSLSGIAAGEAPIELLNTTHKYTPDNPASPIYGRIGPGKPVLITAVFRENGGLGVRKEYSLFQGFIDDFELVPGLSTRSVQITTVDLLGKLKENVVSTELYQGIRSGDAIHKVLDAVGWPEDRREIDPGASIFQWWWEEGTDGFEAIQKIVNSEGTPSIFYIDPAGLFVFRDRHHRVIQERSKDVQTSLTPDGPEPAFSDPFSYDIGWRDLINKIEISIDRRVASSNYEEAFTTEDSYTLVAGQSLTIPVQTTDPFFNAITPVAGIDYTLVSGTVQVSISRTSGASADINITATGGPAYIQGMTLRAILVPVAESYKFTAEDVESIAEHGIKTPDLDMPWVSLTDIAGISEVLLGTRSTRRPVIQYTLNNGSEERLISLLGGRLSDRIHLEEPETFTDHDFFIEQIEHSVSQAGLYHTAQFGCERSLDQPANVFTFDDASRGFNDGVFGYRGIDSENTVFILDTSELNVGLLGH